MPLTLSDPNGVSETAQYDANSALTRLTAAGPAQTPATTTLQSAYAYGYNAAGWITRTTTLSGTDALTHDASGRLTDECGPQLVTPTHCNHWTYDANGNLLSAVGDSGATDVYTYTAGAGGQINEQVAGGSSDSPPTATIRLAYDGHGDTTSISNAVAQTAQPTDPGYKKYARLETFAYDAQQRPITVTRLDSTKVGTQTIVTPLTATVQYNADGLRSGYRLTPDPRTGKTAVDTRFAYRAGQLASATVTDSTGTLLYKNTFLYGPGGEPLELVRTNPNGTTSRYWYVLDGLGSVVALTSITGTVVDRYAYDSWGEQTSNDATDETVPQQLRYHGYYYDEKLTWYWVTTRYYDPEGMRWLQPDPSNQDGVRTYAYVGDDPVDAVDPLGLCIVLLHREAAIDAGVPIPFTNYTVRPYHLYLTLNESDPHNRRTLGRAYLAEGRPDVYPPNFAHGFGQLDAAVQELHGPKGRFYRYGLFSDEVNDKGQSRKTLAAVVDDNKPCACYLQRLRAVAKRINQLHLPYVPGSLYSQGVTNSNSVAYTYLRELGLLNPGTAVARRDSASTGIYGVPEDVVAYSWPDFYPGWGVDLFHLIHLA